MLKALKKLNVGLAATCANTSGEIDQEETGTWHYLVVDTSGIRPREDACYTKDVKRTDLDRLKDGTVVSIDRRRRSGWVRWLSLASGHGWVFDVSPKDKKVRMIEVEVLAGEWQYRAVGDRVPILPKPSLHLASLKASKREHALEYREIVTVKERVRPLNGKGSFLKLSDGRGWVLDFVNARQVMQRCESPDVSPGDSAASSEADANTAPLSHRQLENIVSLQGVGKELGEPELGNWNYVVLDPQGICLRSAPTYDKTAKLQHRLEEGEVVQVQERRSGAGTTFLRLESPQGWVFDIQPGMSKQRQRMVEVSVELGNWWYRVCTKKGIALRARCSFSDNCKVGEGPSEGAMLCISKRLRIGNTTFLRPKDGSGWVFDCKNGKCLVEGPVDVEMLQNTTAIVRSMGLYLLAAPINLPWANTHKVLLQGSRAHVTHRHWLNGTEWVRLSQPGSNMDGWAHADALELCHTQDLDARQPHAGFDAERVRAALGAPNPRSC